jgi:hypothetical protein
MELHTYIYGIYAGAAATLTMDVLGSLTRRIGLTVGAEGKWVGRWYLGILKGRFAHADIEVFPEQAGEKQAALAGHYVIGIVLGMFYLAGAHWLGFQADALAAAVGYGLITCAFPWFLVLPALGFGACGKKGPPELKLFRSTVMNHFSYGFGLWWSLNLLPLV